VLKVTVFSGGHGTLLGVINSFVHIIMYTYYLLAALGPTVQKYLWWKKYITSLQMVRHFVVAELDRQGYTKLHNYYITGKKHTYYVEIKLRTPLLQAKQGNTGSDSRLYFKSVGKTGEA
jgi:hypothetical protein